MVGFWFLEVTSLLYIVMTLNFFISGHMLPLDLLPEPWSGMLKALPFQYMAYFPAVVFLGKVKGMALVYHLLGELLWAVVLHGPGAGALPARPAALQRLRRLSRDVWRSLGRYFRLLGQPGAVHAEPRAGVPGQLPGQGLGRGALAGRSWSPSTARSSPGRSTIAGWTEPQYFFFVGCFFALNGLIEMLFLENCNEFAELVRTGDLDFLLLKPIDEQFLITCRRIDWGTAPNVLMGAAVMGISLCPDALAVRPGPGRGVLGHVRLRHGDRLQLHAAC